MVALPSPPRWGAHRASDAVVRLECAMKVGSREVRHGTEQMDAPYRSAGEPQDCSGSARQMQGTAWPGSEDLGTAKTLSASVNIVVKGFIRTG